MTSVYALTRPYRATFYVGLRLCVLAACFFALTACGKKPAQVDPPFKMERGAKPPVYPDPSTDPAP